MHGAAPGPWARTCAVWRSPSDLGKLETRAGNTGAETIYTVRRFPSKWRLRRDKAYREAPAEGANGSEVAARVLSRNRPPLPTRSGQ